MADDSVRCPACKAVYSKTALLANCPLCGAALPVALPAPPELINEGHAADAIMLRLDALRMAHEAGKISASEFNRLLGTLQFNDGEGNLWAPGAVSEAWYKRVGEKWVKSAPPERLYEIEPLKTTSRTARTPPAHATGGGKPATTGSGSGDLTAAIRRDREAISAKQLAELAGTLMRAVDLQIIDPDHLQSLRKALVVVDQRGGSWFVGLRSGQFKFWSDNAWQEASPPTELWIQRDLLKQLQSFEAQVAQAEALAMKPPREQTSDSGTISCKDCGASIGRGQQFCGKCGTRVQQQPAASQANCTNCGAALKLGKKFCAKCGESVA